MLLAKKKNRLKKRKQHNSEANELECNTNTLSSRANLFVTIYDKKNIMHSQKFLKFGYSKGTDALWGTDIDLIEHEHREEVWSKNMS